MEAVLVTVGRDHDMTNKRIRLPKDGVQGSDPYQAKNAAAVDGGEDVQGHGLGEPDKHVKSEPAVDDGEDFQGRGDDYQARGDGYQGRGDDVQGHGLGEPDKQVKSQPAVDDGEDYQGRGDGYQGRGEDVQGHSFVQPAPPADFSKRGPSSGGEFVRNHEDADASD
jgi:hypothetical protein